MAIDVWERLGSRELRQSDDGFESLWLVSLKGSNDELAVFTALDNFMPIFYAGMPRSSLDGMKQVGDEYWEADVTYKESKPPGSQGQPGQPSTFSFDTTGGTMHLKQSLATQVFPSSTGPFSTAIPLLKGAIGVTRDGTVEGTDIDGPALKFSEKHVLSPSQLTFSYVNLLYFLGGRVNSTHFRGFAPGEVKFKGATGSGDNLNPSEVEYHFECSPNDSNLTVAGISGITKEGWDYLWPYYGIDLDTATETMLPKVLAVFVERVSFRADFALLGI